MKSTLSQRLGQSLLWQIQDFQKVNLKSKNSFQNMGNKFCTFCKKDIPLSEYNYRNGHPLYNCKKCISIKRQKRYLEHREENIRKVQMWVEANRARSNENKARWKRNHREQVLQIGKTYYLKNREKILARHQQYRMEHPDLRKETMRLWKLKHHLNEWIVSLNKPINKAVTGRNCDVCGLRTNKAQLYIFNDKFFCVECLKDFKETTRVLPELKKIVCSECGRLTIDTRFPKCVDCRVKRRANVSKSYYAPTFIDMGRFREID